jgi:hypothetical protein
MHHPERSLRRGSSYALAANSKELPLSGARVLEEFPLARVQEACMKLGGHDRGGVDHRGYALGVRGLACWTQASTRLAIV